MEKDKAEFFKVIEMEEEHLTSSLNRRLSEVKHPLNCSLKRKKWSWKSLWNRNRNT
jgi:hypothetical protein